MNSRGPFRGAKQLGCESGHPPPTISDGNNEWIYTSSLHAFKHAQ